MSNYWFPPKAASWQLMTDAEYEAFQAIPTFQDERNANPEPMPEFDTVVLWKCKHCGGNSQSLTTCPHCGGPGGPPVVQ
jgi:rubrerythrin